MPYHESSVQGRLLAGDDETLLLVRRWISESLTAARYWHLRSDWRDLQQEVLSRLVDSLRQERFRADGELKSYVQGICRHTAQNWRAGRTLRPSGAMLAELAEMPSSADPEQRLISDQLVR